MTEVDLTMARRVQDFQSIRSEGGLLPPDLLRRVLDPRDKLPGTLPEEYGLPKSERLNEVITQSWNRLQKHWAVFPLLSEYSLSLEYILSWFVVCQLVWGRTKTSAWNHIRGAEDQALKHGLETQVRPQNGPEIPSSGNGLKVTSRKSHWIP